MIDKSIKPFNCRPRSLHGLPRLDPAITPCRSQWSLSVVIGVIGVCGQACTGDVGNAYDCESLEGSVRVGRRLGWEYSGPLEVGDEVPMVTIEDIVPEPEGVAYRAAVMGCAFGFEEMPRELDAWAEERLAEDGQADDDFQLDDDVTITHFGASIVFVKQAYPTIDRPADAVPGETHYGIGVESARMQAEDTARFLRDHGLFAEGAWALDDPFELQRIESTPQSADDNWMWVTDYEYDYPPAALPMPRFEGGLSIDIVAHGTLRKVWLHDQHLDVESMVPVVRSETEAKALVDAYIAEQEMMENAPEPFVVEDEGVWFYHPPGGSNGPQSPYWVTVFERPNEGHVAARISLVDETPEVHEDRAYGYE